MGGIGGLNVRAGRLPGTRAKEIPDLDQRRRVSTRDASMIRTYPSVADDRCTSHDAASATAVAVSQLGRTDGRDLGQEGGGAARRHIGRCLKCPDPDTLPNTRAPSAFHCLKIIPWASRLYLTKRPSPVRLAGTQEG